MRRVIPLNGCQGASDDSIERSRYALPERSRGTSLDMPHVLQRPFHRACRPVRSRKIHAAPLSEFPECPHFRSDTCGRSGDAQLRSEETAPIETDDGHDFPATPVDIHSERFAKRACGQARRIQFVAEPLSSAEERAGVKPYSAMEMNETLRALINRASN